MQGLGEEIQARAVTVAAAKTWIGLGEGSSPVTDLVTRYATCWQWPAEDVPGMDWCMVWALSMTWAAVSTRSPLTLHHEWPEAWKGATPRHWFGHWSGQVSEVRDAAVAAEIASPYPQVGALALFGWGHVGIVVGAPEPPMVAVGGEAAAVLTVEGNVGDRVDLRERKAGEAVYVPWWLWPSGGA